jgi:hypothetical protein
LPPYSQRKERVSNRSLMNYQVNVYKNFDQVAPVSPFWRSWQWNPYSDLDYVQFKFQNITNAGKPFILALSLEGSLVTILTASIEMRPLHFQFGYKYWTGPTLKTLTVDRYDVLGWQDAEVWMALLECFKGLLDSKVVELIRLKGFPLDSPPHKIPLPGLPWLCGDPLKHVQESWVLTCPNGFGDFLKKHRGLKDSLRRGLRRMKKLAGEDIVIRCYKNIDDLDTILNHTEQIAQHTWQRGLGGGSFADEEARQRFRFLLQKGWLRSYILYLAGRPVSFNHGLLYQRQYFFETVGYDQAYRREGVGKYLWMKVIEDFSGSGLIDDFVFGEGNSEDKGRSCDRSFQIADRHLFAPTFHIKAFNIFRIAMLASHLLGKKTLKKIGHFESFRRKKRKS